MQVETTKLAGVTLLTPRVFEDARGAFFESWNAAAFSEAGLHRDWAQDNQSHSRAAFTLRGLHFQRPPFAQAKLVRCLQGAIYDVAVDIQVGSPTFGQWIGVELRAETYQQLFIPEGFAHGFVTLTPDAVVSYKASAAYSPAHEGILCWDCPDIAIEWPISGVDPILNDRDAQAPTLAALQSPFEFGAMP
ncbi:MAG: dTDP-4-dehydrorhamnose 3,5-epimerase [Rhodobacteraceae bacterium]|nr:dTDP-4-dehydrorhamnose 3,5-epimerase [Paracoccaceae bacterium]